LHTITVFLQQFGEQRLVHAGAERTLKVIIVDHYDFGVLVAANRAASEVDLAHPLNIRIFGKVQLGHA
jgi:hypothetical protein